MVQYQKKVHRIVKFNPKLWIKTYIDMNNKLRIESKKDFQKNFLNFRNNSVYGKSNKAQGS